MSNPTDNQTSNGRAGSSTGNRARHLYDTGVFHTLPPESRPYRPKVVPALDALAKHGIHTPRPPRIQPAADVSKTQVWPVNPAPAPRRAAPPVEPQQPQADWRQSWRVRLAAGIAAAAVVVIVAVVVYYTPLAGV